MSKMKYINILITYNWVQYDILSVPDEITEIELKLILRKKGFISKDWNAYYATSVYLEVGKNDIIEICINKNRPIKDLGIEEKSVIFIKEGNINEATDRSKIIGTISKILGDARNKVRKDKNDEGWAIPIKRSDDN